MHSRPIKRLRHLMHNRRADEDGTTLIELLVASVIALMILGSVVMTTTVIGGQAQGLTHAANAASNAEQLLDHAATQVSNAEQLGICTQQPCAASNFPPSILLAASSSGLCFAAPITSSEAPDTTPNGPPEAECVVTGSTTPNTLYIDLYHASATTYSTCTSLSGCFDPSPQNCMDDLTQTGCASSGVVTHFLGVLTTTTPFTYYDASGNAVTASGPLSTSQLSTVHAVQLDVTVSAGYGTGHVLRTYSLDYIAALH